jgi:outer membrane protein OmpA-like peptidoglycan-associated protein
MRRRWGIIGGGSALLIGTFVATQSGLFSPPTREAAPEALISAPALPEPIEADPSAEMARLSAALAARETKNAELRTALAVRDAVLRSLDATLVEREATLQDLRSRLAASEAEVAALRSRLEALSDPTGLEAELAVLRADDSPSAARLAAARAEADGLARIFEAKSTPVGLPLPTRHDSTVVEVQFDFASAVLSPGGQAHAAAAAVTLADMPLEGIRIIGHTDRVGSPEANRRLAARRARAVADFLVAAGIPAQLIETDGLGETDAPVATDDGVPEPLNRTVAIVAIPRATS